jgi:phosphatidylglycerophosphate synthase
MMTVPRDATPRRVLATRNAAWPRRLAHRLARIGVRPNAVSVTSVFVAALASIAFVLAPECPPRERAALLLAATAGIQLRLLCNLLDGLLAVEEGLKTKTGEIYNELPDRIADVLILIGAGYSIRELTYGPIVGWAASLLAVCTAYVRLLGGSLGFTQHFSGPMAKQHRMFTLTVCTLAAALEALLLLQPRALVGGLSVIAAGSAATIIRRTRLLLAEANTR